MVISIAGCRSVNSVIKKVNPLEKPVTARILPAYSGPRARIQVADFAVETTKLSQEAGSGLRDIFVNILSDTKRFSPVEHQAAGEAADLIIKAEVTEFDPQSSGGRSGIGGGGGMANGALGTLLGSSPNKARLVMGIRIIDVPSSKVLYSSIAVGQATDLSGSIMEETSGDWKMGTGLADYANTPMEKAIRVCMVEAVRQVAESIPQQYYKY
jgi:curli biogenesis system outer membrane secretion channel CsgG